MTRGHGTSGSRPVLTAAQRAEVARVLRRRWRIKAAMRALERMLDAEPTNSELVAKYGVTVQTLHAAALKSYAKPHRLDEPNYVPRESKQSEIRP
jgi:DNA-directed RNA polymerase specialized sigma subunit